MKAAAAVTLQEQNWMRQQGRRLKTLRGDVSFLRFPLNSDQVLVLSLTHTSHNAINTKLLPQNITSVEEVVRNTTGCEEVVVLEEDANLVDVDVDFYS